MTRPLTKPDDQSCLWHSRITRPWLDCTPMPAGALPETGPRLRWTAVTRAALHWMGLRNGGNAYLGLEARLTLRVFKGPFGGVANAI